MASQPGNYLKDIIISLCTNGIQFIICGGVALVLHGIERMTLDLDLALDLDHDNLEKFLRVMSEHHFSPRVPVPAESILDPEKRNMMIHEKNALVFTFIDVDNVYKQIDIFLKDEMSYQALKNNSEKIVIEGHEVNILSKQKLLEMKRLIKPPREKDIHDISVLEKLLRINNDRSINTK